MSKEDLAGFLALALVVAVLIGTANCQTTAADPVVDKKFLIGQAASFTATYLDAHETESCISKGYTEADPLYGKRPSAGHMYGESFGFAIAGAVASYEFKKHHSRLWMLPPIENTAVHAFGAAWDYSHCQ